MDIDTVEVVGDPGRGCCVLWGVKTPLELAEEPMGCEPVETMTQDSSSKDSCLKEDQKTRALAGDGQGTGAGIAACVCHRCDPSREKQMRSLCRWLRGRDRASSASIACHLLGGGGAYGEGGTGRVAVTPHCASTVAVGAARLGQNSCKRSRLMGAS